VAGQVRPLRAIVAGNSQPDADAIDRLKLPTNPPRSQLAAFLDVASRAG